MRILTSSFENMAPVCMYVCLRLSVTSGCLRRERSRLERLKKTHPTKKISNYSYDYHYYICYYLPCPPVVRVAFSQLRSNDSSVNRARPARICTLLLLLLLCFKRVTHTHTQKKNIETYAPAPSFFSNFTSFDESFHAFVKSLMSVCFAFTS